MPRVRRNATSLVVVQAQITRMQAALAKLQVEIARLHRAEVRSLARSGRSAPGSLQEARAAAEREFILQIGEDCRWNRSRMARALGVDRKSLYVKMQKYGLGSAHPATYGPPARAVAKAVPAATPRRRR